MLLKADNEATKLIKDIQTAIDEHTAAGKKLMDGAAERRDTRDSLEKAAGSSSKGKGKAREITEDIDSLDGDDDGLPKTADAEEHQIKRRALQQRLRECQITLHRVHFLKGDVYHSLGESHSDDESAAYATAEDLRRILLRSKHYESSHCTSLIFSRYRTCCQESHETPCTRGRRERHHTSRAFNYCSLFRQGWD